MKKVIITGGSGLIGRALSALLLQKGYEVVVLSRLPQKLTLPPGMRVLKWDGRTPQGWQNEVEGAYAIVNLAGENIGAGRWTGARKERIRSSRLEAGQAVVQAVASARKKPTPYTAIYCHLCRNNSIYGGIYAHSKQKKNSSFRNTFF
ncbi:MAG: NAD-dependent epimerase/dehydratase family protein [Anaerolineae bacterium]|nr:NAD-dependent epimerase/dehydratase family protein [Anaerolineae bacterium]